MNDLANMVLRYYIGFEKSDNRFDMLVNFLERTGIKRVILFSAPFVDVNSFFPEEYYQKHAQMLKPYIEKLKNYGVDVGINMLYTIGHCFYADENESGFRRAVTIDGENSRGCACPRDEHIDEYIKKIYQYYAALNPSVIFADDDIRAVSMGQLICFCPKHIEMISQRVGKKLTREEIKEHITESGYEDDPIRNAYFEQMKDDINRLFCIIADSVHEISPETEIGIMTTSYPSVTADRDLKEFFDEMLPQKKITRIRTGMDFYREGEIIAIPQNFSHPAIQREFINNPSVEIQPEIENDTYGLYQKSNSITRLQLIWCLTNGFRNMQLNLFDLIDYPVANYEEITEMLVSDTEYRNAITRLIPENHRTEGVSIFAHPRALTKRKNGFLFSANWYSWLQMMGIPVCTDKKSAEFIFLTGDDVVLCDDEEIDQLLKKGAVIDLRAAKSLVYRGFGERIGIKKIEPLTEIFAGERFTDHDFNEEYKGCHNSHYFNSSLIPKDCVAKITYYDSAKPASSLINHKHETVAPGAVAYENKDGERFFILPSADDGAFVFFTAMNPKRRRQLINAFSWIAHKPLPIYADNERMCVNINRRNQFNVITLFNLSCDEVKSPILHYKPIGCLKYLSNDGRLYSLSYTDLNDRLMIEKKMRAFEALVIVDERIK